MKAFNKEYLISQEKGKESFVNEIYLLRALDNNCILKLFEIYETENSLYMVMELIRGGEMLHQINHQKFDEKTISICMHNLLVAVNHMHSLNIIHRDLKPDNILLKNTNSITEIVIADFGLATFLDFHNQMFKRCGTPGYVAPEILGYKDGKYFYN